MWLQEVVGKPGGRKKGGTRQVKKKYSTATQRRLAALKKNTWSTLGTKNMAKLVAVPEGENEMEWISMNVIDMFNEVELLFEFCEEAEDVPHFKPGKGFPPGVVYKWKNANGKAKPVSGPDYCRLAISLIDVVIGNEEVFPESDTTTFPPNFIESYVKDIMVKLFRVYAIILCVYKDALKQMEVDQNLHTSFKVGLLHVIKVNLSIYLRQFCSILYTLQLDSISCPLMLK